MCCPFRVSLEDTGVLPRPNYQGQITRAKLPGPKSALIYPLCLNCAYVAAIRKAEFVAL